MGQVSAGSAFLLRRFTPIAVPTYLAVPTTYLAVLLVADPAALETEDAGGLPALFGIPLAVAEAPAA